MPFKVNYHVRYSVYFLFKLLNKCDQSLAIKLTHANKVGILVFIVLVTGQILTFTFSTIVCDGMT